MTTYGSLPGVRIKELTGGLEEVEVGRDQKLIFVGVGNSGATGDVGKPIPIELETVNDQQQVKDTKFGSGSDIVQAAEQAIEVGARPEFMYGVLADTQTESQTDIADTGSLNQSPIVEDKSRITVDNDSTGDPIDVEFKYGGLGTPADSDVIFIDPINGDYEVNPANAGDTVNITYDYVDWTPGLDGAVSEIRRTQFAVVTPLTHNENVATELESKLSDPNDGVRPRRYGLGIGVMPAEPNSDEVVYSTRFDADPELRPGIDASTFSHGFNESDTLFLFGPSALEGYDKDASPYWPVSLAGYYAGTVASNLIGDPMYTEVLQTGDERLAQRLSRGEVQLIREADTIPILDDRETIRSEDNTAAYDWDPDTEWERDLFRRQVVDLTVATTYELAQNAIGAVLDQNTVEDLRDDILEMFVDFEERGYLQQGGQSVDVTRVDRTTIEVEIEITPYGVTKSADLKLAVQI
jgi:hypothetical protein